MSELAIPKSAYETHITVEWCDQGLLFAFVQQLEDENLINIRATCPQTFYGAHPIQPMLTYWYTGYDEDATKLACEMGERMTKFGMQVKRVKVEARFSGSQVPDYADDTHYFEFHFKVETSTNKEWNDLATLCASSAAHLSFNMYSKKGNMIPIVTLRKYSISKQQVLIELEDLQNKIKEYGFTVIGKPEREYSVYDTNIFLDEGWLFHNTPDNVITNVPNQIPIL